LNIIPIDHKNYLYLSIMRCTANNVYYNVVVLEMYTNVVPFGS